MTENNIEHSDSSGLKKWFDEEMAKSGIPEEFASELGWRVISSGNISLAVGFRPNCGNFPVEGFSIPYPAADGQALETPDGDPYLRIRLRHPAQMTDGKDGKIKSAKYLTPKGAGIAPYILPGVHDWLTCNTAAPMLITEGEKKVVSAFVKGFVIVGIPGIWCWSDGEKNLHPMLTDYLKGRSEVILIYDSDARNQEKKPDFDRCAEYLANALIPFDCILKVWIVPGDEAEDKVGLDDWLVAGSTPEMAMALIARDAVTVFPRPRVDVNPGRIIPVAELIGQSAARRGVLFRYTSDITSMSGEAMCNPEEKGSICLLNPTDGVSLFETIASPFKQTPKGPVNALFAESRVRQIASTPAFLRQLPPLVALTHIFAPAFAMSGVLPCSSPILAIEANDSQAGKGKKEKRTTAIYNSAPVIANQPGGSIGSIEEEFDAAQISGAEFISLDNLEQQGQKPFSSPKICSALTEAVYTARAAYSKNVQLDPRRRIVMLTANSVVLSKDILNRCCMVRLIKQNDRRFKEYPEGSQENHIRANYPVYLGAVFRVIREWHHCGCPQSPISVPTGFERWWRVMDWIVVNIFKLASVIDGYGEISVRITDPELSWLRNVVNAVVEAGKADQPLQVTELLEIMLEASIALPGCAGVYAVEQLTQEKQKTLILITGQRISRLFRKHGKQDSIVITPWRITRKEEQRNYFPGHKEIKFYTISQLPTVSGNVIMKDNSQQPESPLPVIAGEVVNDHLPEQTVSGVKCITETVMPTVISGDAYSNEIVTPPILPTVSGRECYPEKISFDLF